MTPLHGAAQAGRLGIALYIFHNIVYTAASYPAGALGDRVNKMFLLSLGYAIFVIMCIGFILASANLAVLVTLFALAGIYIAIVDAMERAIAADLLPLEQRGTGYGALATVNSIGDLVSSITVGFLWSNVSINSGFCFAAATTLLGALAMLVFAKIFRPAGN